MAAAVPAVLFPVVPYVFSNTGALYEAIRCPQPVALPDQPAISFSLRDLLTRLLDKDPTTRIKLDEVCAWGRAGMFACVCV
jgi:hypothetical protein